MLGRTLDDSYSDVVRRDVTTVTVARLTANAAYRFAPPFLATIARGLDVGLDRIGVALAVTELGGFASPAVGRLVDRLPRRPTIAAGLVGVGAGAGIAAAAPGVGVFTVGLLALSLSKIVFDVALGSWITDHVPYERRGRIVGITETSWALGLLLGVSAMGVVTALSSWRWGYVLAVAGVLTMAVVITRRLDPGPAPPPRHDDGGPPPRRLPRQGWLALVGFFALMAASQALFVTFGAWLEDRFGIGPGGLAAVTFGIGGLELLASTTSAKRTDRWGKERSIVRGTALMVPAALLLVAVDGHVVPGLVVLGLFIGAFEFSIVSAIPIGGDLVPGSPGRGLGMLIACGTLGRAAMSIPATALYEHHGLDAPALLGAGAAAVAGVAMTARARSRAR